MSDHYVYDWRTRTVGSAVLAFVLSPAVLLVLVLIAAALR